MMASRSVPDIFAANFFQRPFQYQDPVARRAPPANAVLHPRNNEIQNHKPDDDDRPTRGIRQFTVGTGGASLYEFISRANNSEMRMKQFGVLKLTLNADSYDWQFISVAGPGDSGHGVCH